MPRGGYDSTYIPKAPKAFDKPDEKDLGQQKNGIGKDSMWSDAAEVLSPSRELTVNVGWGGIHIANLALHFDGLGINNNAAIRLKDTTGGEEGRTVLSISDGRSDQSRKCKWP
ncbi:hypothetical protein D0869_06282 [Hortaea werneckii]|uniref:Uncharacterized protein n=1 Tax=Hortaea werneckii TaxID=91943 RepID=A0A3M6WUM7_HORWE|nr:hypothetical protein KC334_g12669 [Hortaea werneckii]KAI6972659.1 hypothetical protein KC355_g11638 [Hortaea werneckii]KAI7156968.1 hypothetical protein KC324_g13976 [Hortaea werneckii]KAI7555687.1 hypothetical protein KC316_g13737 [Hortaea werneckii]KAI7670890.1 hypothetical protein KC318_g3789 [Hortaea werneckii]